MATGCSNYRPSGDDDKRRSESERFRLEMKPLYVRADSITLSSIHKQILLEKKLQLEDRLNLAKESLEERLNTGIDLRRASLHGHAHQQKHPSQGQDGEPTVELRQFGSTSSPGRDSDTLFDESRQTDALRHKFQCELNSLQCMCQAQLDALFARYQKEWRKDPRKESIMALPASLESDSKYLARVLGHALTRGLAEVCERRPWDPIEYLALWLKKQAQNDEHNRQEAIERLQTQLALEEEERQKEHQAALRNEARIMRGEEQRRAEMFLNRSQEIEELEQNAELEAEAPAVLEPQEQSQEGPEGEVSNVETVQSDQQVEHIGISPATEGLNDAEDDPQDGNLYTIQEKE